MNLRQRQEKLNDTQFVDAIYTRAEGIFRRVSTNTNERKQTAFSNKVTERFFGFRRKLRGETKGN